MHERQAKSELWGGKTRKRNQIEALWENYSDFGVRLSCAFESSRSGLWWNFTDDSFFPPLLPYRCALCAFYTFYCLSTLTLSLARAAPFEEKLTKIDVKKKKAHSISFFVCLSADHRSIVNAIKFFAGEIAESWEQQNQSSFTLSKSRFSIAKLRRCFLHIFWACAIKQVKQCSIYYSQH